MTSQESIRPHRHDVPERTIEAGAGFRQGLWHSYSVTDGLPSSIILQMHEDRDSRIWFVTEQGVCAFDGSSFRILDLLGPLEGAPVQHIAEDELGRLWMWAPGRLACYAHRRVAVFEIPDDDTNPNCQIATDGRGHVWIAGGGVVLRYDGECLRPITLPGPIQGLSIRMLADDKGVVWFASANRLWRGVDDDIVDARVQIAGDDDVVDLLVDGGGALWMATRQTVARFDGHDLKPIGHREGLFSSRLMGLRSDAVGNLWLLTDIGVSRFDGSTFAMVSKFESPVGDLAPSFLVDREANAWITTRLGGVFRGRGNEVVQFTTAEGLAHDAVNGVLEDRDGRIWIGTHGGGVSRYNGAQFRIFTTQDGLAHNGMDPLLEDSSGKLWIGTAAGLSRYDGNSFQTFSQVQGIAAAVISAILQDRSGRIWVGTRDRGVYTYDGVGFTSRRASDGLVDDSVNAIMEDRAGNIWIGTGSGLSRYDGLSFTNFTTDDGMPHQHIRSLCEDVDGNIWLGTMGGGVIRFDGDRFHAFTTRQGLPDNRIQALLQDRNGLLWLGTRGGGLTCYDGETFTTYNRSKGLTDDHVRAISEDQSGCLWIGTYGGGVDRFNGTVFQALSRQDGLASNTVNQIVEDANGVIWIAIDGGLTRYRPQITAPRLRLEVIAERPYGEVEEVRLSEAQEFVIFEFTGKSLSTSPNRMAYVYKLDGVDSDWQVSYNRRVEYHDVGIGSYRFFAKAVDRDLNYSDVVEIQLEVIPDPRDEQIDELEARVTARTRELAKLNNELEQRVEERTTNLQSANEKLQSFALRLEQSNRELQDFAYVSSHDLQEPLRKIQAFGGRLVAKESDGLSDQGRDYLARMQDAARRMQILINDLLTFSRVTTRGQPFVPVDLRDAAETVVSDLEVRLEQEGGKIRIGELPVVEADPTQMHQLLQNLIGNALKFHRPNQVPVVVADGHEVDGSFVLSIADNGIGFEEKYLDRIFSPFQRLHGRSEYEGTGMGLAICRKIVERHGGSITANSEPDVGTTFEVTIPLTHSTGDGT